MPGRFRWLIFAISLVTLAACSIPIAPTPTPLPLAETRTPEVGTTPSPIDTPTAGSTATSEVSSAGGQVPNSCDMLVSLVGAYMGGVATTKSLGKPQHLSCEFANADASTIVIVNIGVGGTAATFDTLR